MSWDAGLVNVTAAIGDLIWFDNNRNGVQDRDTEAGVDGVLVVLEYAADNTAEDPAEWGWREIAYEVTSNGGHYDFLDLKKGYYRLNFYLPQTYEVTMLESEEAIEAVGESMAYKFDSDAIPVEEKTVFTDGHAVQPASGGIAAGVMAEGIANFSAAETGITIDPQDWAKVNYPDGYRHLTRMVELQEEKSDWSWDAGIYQPRDAGTSYEYREGEVITRTYGDGTGVNGMSSRGDVRTGDESVLWLWIALAAGAGVVIALTLRARRRAYGRRH
ncbi:MAG TPA: hypothetical protein DEB31_09960 [Clostridiales bacterium]|nr:hypothetical protein [Clostridiales bacterium]